VVSTATTQVTEQQVRDTVEAVRDPGMDPVTVGDLGMLVDVRSQGARVEVDLVPTYMSCPATALIRADVEQAVRALPGVEAAEVRFVTDLVWTPDRITQEGRDKLAEFAVAHPGPRRIGRLAGMPCPVCGSTQTVVDSPFGPTPCRSTLYCKDCRNPFEAIKP
jgi:ring-1,2-phenylacetyl-CoA epoxidase subunit PaaD